MLRLSLLLAGSMCMDDADVQNWIERLGDEQYAIRVEAQATLERALLSPRGHLIRPLIEAAAEHPDLEIARRARTLMNAYYNLIPANYPALPWIDMLPVGQPGRQTIIESCLIEVRSPNSWGYGADWPEYRQATGVMTRRLLDQGFPRHCVRQLLDDMVEQERQYREKHGMRELAAR